MKRTDLERSERDYKKSEKKKSLIEKCGENQSSTQKVGYYIDTIFSLFRYDTEEIFNAKDNIDILEILECIQADLPEKQWDNIIRKAVKKTKVTNKEKAVKEIKELIDI